MSGGEIEYYYSEDRGEWYGKDDHGDFPLQAGSRTPVDPDDYSYDPCGAVLRHSYERYGEPRYCEAMAVSNFSNVEHDREYDSYCKNHQDRGALMDYVEEERAQHLAFAQSYESIFEYMDVHKKIMSVEMFASLMNESEFDFDPTYVVSEVDAETDLFDDDTVNLDFPVPNEHVARAKALWFAALNFVQMENIMEEQFRVAAEETGPDGEPLAMGEKTTVVTVTDDGRPIEDKDEHHLNLPLSRIQKDYERHLKVGGVSLDGDEVASESEAREWVFKIESTEDVKPEATRDENPMSQLDTPTDDDD